MMNPGRMKGASTLESPIIINKELCWSQKHTSIRSLWQLLPGSNKILYRLSNIMFSTFCLTNTEKMNSSPNWACLPVAWSYRHKKSALCKEKSRHHLMWELALTCMFFEIIYAPQISSKIVVDLTVGWDMTTKCIHAQYKNCSESYNGPFGSTPKWTKIESNLPQQLAVPDRRSIDGARLWTYSWKYF